MAIPANTGAGISPMERSIAEDGTRVLILEDIVMGSQIFLMSLY